MEKKSRIFADAQKDDDMVELIAEIASLHFRHPMYLKHRMSKREEIFKIYGISAKKDKIHPTLPPSKGKNEKKQKNLRCATLCKCGTSAKKLVEIASFHFRHPMYLKHRMSKR